MERVVEKCRRLESAHANHDARLSSLEAHEVRGALPAKGATGQTRRPAMRDGTIPRGLPASDFSFGPGHRPEAEPGARGPEAEADELSVLHRRVDGLEAETAALSQHTVRAVDAVGTEVQAVARQALTLESEVRALQRAVVEGARGAAPQGAEGIILGAERVSPARAGHPHTPHPRASLPTPPAAEQGPRAARQAVPMSAPRQSIFA